MSKSILLVGEKNSGKSTVADMLGFPTTALAAPLKNFAELVFQFSKEQLHGPSEKREELHPIGASADFWDQAFQRLMCHRADFILSLDFAKEKQIEAQEALTLWFMNERQHALNHGLTARRILQTLGTEWGRKLDPTVWLRAGVRSAQAAQREPGQPVVIVDGRFGNEGDFFRERGAMVVKIVGPPREGAPEHASEAEIASMLCHVEINNVDRGPNALADLAERVEDLRNRFFVSEYPSKSATLKKLRDVYPGARLQSIDKGGFALCYRVPAGQGFPPQDVQVLELTPARPRQPNAVAFAVMFEAFKRLGFFTRWSPVAGFSFVTIPGYVGPEKEPVPVELDAKPEEFERMAEAFAERQKTAAADPAMKENPQ